jgi:hypothetical protein
MFSLFKKPLKENIKKEKFLPILNNIIELLYENSNVGQAEWVEKIKSSLLKNDNDSFKKKLISVDMWGGPGAVWEVGFIDNNEKEKKFILELIKLLDLIKESGIKSKGAYSRKKILQKLLREM